MEFSWDPAKNEENLRQRGFDFEFASLIFRGPTLERRDQRREYGEPRVIAIGLAEGLELTVVYTDRPGKPTVGGSFRLEGAIVMSAKRTKQASKAAERPTRGKADLGRLRVMTETEIERTSSPELADLPDDFWAAAELVLPVPKQAISLRVDEDVLEWFRGLGPRYQTRMNAVLRSYMTRASKRSHPRVRRDRKGAA